MIATTVLLNALKAHLLSACKAETAPTQLQGIFLADDGMTCESGMGYVGESAEISRLLSQGKPGCAFFVAGRVSDLPELPPDTALAVTDLPLAALYNTLSRAAIAYTGWEKSLLTGVSGGLSNLLQTASALFGFSAAVLDSDQRPLAQSILEADQSAMTLDAAGPTGHTASILNELKNHLSDSGPRSLASQQQDDRNYLLTAMQTGGGVLGYLLVCAKADGSTPEARVLALAHILSEQMTTRMEETGVDAFQSIAAQFLGEYPGNLDVLQKQLEQLPQKPPRFMRAVVIRQLDSSASTSPAAATQKLEHLFRELRQLYPRYNIALLANYILLLTGAPHPESPAAIIEDEQFEQVLERHEAFAMVSSPSQWLRNLRRLVKQAFRVLPVAVAVRFQDEKQRRCLKFERYAPYYLIHLCETALQLEISTNDIVFLCDTAVLTLTRYDRAFNSNLRDTLLVFLRNNCNISATSRTMYVHRNTVIYKLNLIRSLIGDKMDDPPMRTQLLMSCMIIRYLEEYRRQPINLPPFEKSMLRLHE